jgi:DNA replication protein DnaC
VSAAPGLPVEVEQLMRQLKMPYARALAPELIATAKAQRWDPVEVVKALFVEEVAGRGRSMLATRRKAAGFPTGKTFQAWDPDASSIPQPTQQALQTREWVHRRENLVVCGPSGTGKTFFLEALGQHVVETGRRVAWFTLEQLDGLVRAHRTDDTVSKAVARILRADLVVVDDIGLLPVSHYAAEGLYRIVDAAYEKHSIALSSNSHPAGFDELMPKTLATAPSTGSSTTPTSAKPAATRSASPKPSPGKESTPSPEPPDGQPRQQVGRSVGHHRALLMATSGQVY